MTDQEILQKGQILKNAGVSPDKIRQFIELAKSEQASVSGDGSNVITQEEPGIIKGTVQGIAHPFLRATSNVLGIGEAIGAGLKGDLRGVAHAVDPERERDFGYFGKAKAVTSPKDVFAVGGEIGSFAGGGAGVIKAAIKRPLLYAIGQGAKIGATGGVVGGASTELEKEGATPQNIIGGAAIGGTIGGALGGLVPGAEKTAIGAGRLAKGVFRAARQASKTKNELSMQPELVQKIVQTGIDFRDADFIHSALQKTGDKQAMLKMYKAAESAEKTRLPFVRPTEIAGDTIMNRVGYIGKTRDTIGKRLGEITRSMPIRPIDITDVYQNFSIQLQNAGVKIKANGQLDFRGSRIGGLTGASNRNLLQSIVDDLRPNTQGLVLRTPQRINTIRQRLFGDLKLGKQQQALEDYTMTLGKNIRGELDKPLQALSPEYKKHTTAYAETTEALKEFYSLVGQKWDESDLVSLRAGEVYQRILGNASARPTESLRMLEKTARKYGLKTDDDPVNQILFADFLEDLFGTTQTRSLRGQVGRGIEDTKEVVDIAGDVARRDIFSIVKKGTKLLSGQTNENQKEVIKKLLGL